MKKELKIDKAIYLVDEDEKTYMFLRRNLDWKELDPKENTLNKKHLNGYKRIFRDKRTKIFRSR
jgi:hypothetical protein